MKKQKKSFAQKVKQFNRILRSYEERIKFHENNYKFLVKLSLDYEHAIKSCNYQPSHDAKSDIKAIFAFSQKHIQMRANYVKKYLEFQKHVNKMGFGMFVSVMKVNEKSYFDDLI